MIDRSSCQDYSDLAPVLEQIERQERFDHEIRLVFMPMIGVGVIVALAELAIAIGVI